MGGLSAKVPIEERRTKIGKGLIDVKWVNVRKTSRDKSRTSIRHTTPLIEAFRLVMSAATSSSKEKGALVNDLSRAHVYVQCHEDVYCGKEIDLMEEKDSVTISSKPRHGATSAAKMWQNMAASNRKRLLG